MGASIRIKDGNFYVFVRHQGERAAKKYDSQEEAQKVARAVNEKMLLGEFDLRAMKERAAAAKEEKERAVTLAEYYQQFARVYLATAVRETTRKSYETSFRAHILPRFGSLPLSQISKPQVKEFIAHLVSKNLAKKTIYVIVSELCTLLNHAIEDKLITENPAAKMGKFYKQARTVHEEIQPLTYEEVPVFLNAVLEHAPEYYPLILCAIHTGMRSGELAGLQWGDIDSQGRFITVRRQFTVHGRIEPTKTSRIRKIDMSDTLAVVLADLRRQRKAENLAQGENEIPAWVFPNRRGKPVDMHNLKNRHFYRCLEKAGLRRIRFHDLRHSFASLLIQNGESLAYIRDQLGHSSIKMTVDIYGHLVPGANRQAVNKLPAIGGILNSFNLEAQGSF